MKKQYFWLATLLGLSIWFVCAYAQTVVAVSGIWTLTRGDGSCLLTDYPTPRSFSYRFDTEGNGKYSLGINRDDVPRIANQNVVLHANQQIWEGDLQPRDQFLYFTLPSLNMIDFVNATIASPVVQVTGIGVDPNHPWLVDLKDAKKLYLQFLNCATDVSREKIRSEK